MVCVNLCMQNAWLASSFLCFSFAWLWSCTNSSIFSHGDSCTVSATVREWVASVPAYSIRVVIGMSNLFLFWVKYTKKSNIMFQQNQRVVRSLSIYFLHTRDLIFVVLPIFSDILIIARWRGNTGWLWALTSLAIAINNHHAWTYSSSLGLKLWSVNYHGAFKFGAQAYLNRLIHALFEWQEN